MKLINELHVGKKRKKVVIHVRTVSNAIFEIADLSCRGNEIVIE